jgi:DNA gyrase subunit A
LLGLRPDERIQGMLALRELEQDDVFVLTVTRLGTVKRTPLKAYANIRSTGLIALHLDEGDSLKSVHLVREEDQVFIATRQGMAIRFPASDARSMGRPARGVRGIALSSGDAVVSASVVQGDEDILTVTARGYGKRTHIDEYRLQGRGGQGLTNLKVQARTGPVVAAVPVRREDEVIVATREGQVIRTAVEQDAHNRIRRMGRSTQGVRVISLRDPDEVVAVSRGGQVQNGDIDGSAE